MLTSYAYASVPCGRFDPAMLDQILTTARRRNPELGITGALYSDGETFFHVIEGHEPVLAQLMSRILRDPRHHEVVILDQTDLDDRMFADFAIKHVDGQDNTGLRQMFSFRQLINANEDYVAARVRDLVVGGSTRFAGAAVRQASRLVAVR